MAGEIAMRLIGPSRRCFMNSAVGFRLEAPVDAPSVELAGASSDT